VGGHQGYVFAESRGCGLAVTQVAVDRSQMHAEVLLVHRQDKQPSKRPKAVAIWQCFGCDRILLRCFLPELPAGARRTFFFAGFQCRCE
jgi:hypothetical protein